MRSINILMVLAMAVAWAPPAHAVDPALTFSFSDLSGDFDAGGTLFTAVDGDDTDGDVTRLDPFGDAIFDGVLATSQFFSLEMSVFPMGLEDPTQILASAGTLVVTDLDGDTLSGSVSGVWLNTLGSADFVGTIQGLVITTDDNEFNGTGGTFCSLDGLAGVFDGDIMTLTFGTWFTDAGGTFQDFSDASTLAVGAIVPEPATLWLLALGTLAISTGRQRPARG